ncbi:MAG: hypothetical protein V4850_15700 [Myxococcota bacterium]
MEDREVGRAALIALPTIGVTVRNLLAPVESIVGRVPDDALFYLVLARRLVAGEGFTFDGVSPTTGFHPAWLAIVTALVPTGDPVAGLRGLLLLHGLVTLVSVLLLDRVARKAGASSGWSALGAAAAGAWGASAYGLGMETALVGALALAVLTLEGRGLHHGRKAWLLGLGMGLTRVDAIPLLLGAGRQAPAALLGGLCGVAITAGFNRAVAGEWASTAASIKGLGTVAARLGRLDPEGVWRHVPGPAVAAIVVMGGWFVSRRYIRSTSEVSDVSNVSVSVLGGAAWIGASYLFNNLVGPWYFLPLTWVLLAAALGRGGLPTLVLVVALLGGVALPAPGLHATVVAFAHDVAARAPVDARIVAEDFPGALAWFGERTVFPADGLAASPDYRAALTTGAALPWWEARGATHYAVTRRREAWLLERPLIDRIAPPFLAVPPSPVPLDPARVVTARTDAGGRVFVLIGLGP